MEKLIDISSYPVVPVLDLLLQDKTTKKNIIWATDTYEEFGEEFTDKVQLDANALLRRTDLIRPRIQKSQEAQAERTRKKAEVFTPAWLCNRMNNHCDDDWFGRSGVFNTENADHTWTMSEGKIEFPKRRKWQRYVDSRRLEITCGEAPYLVSRYDVSTGELIVPPIRRIGMLDRKLRIVNENTDKYDDWLKWTIRAFEACYGYEYQGDNVLIARINLLLTFTDYYEERWERQLDDKLLQQMANKIAWNIWQMDGLKDTVPLGKPYEEFKQMTFFDLFEDMSDGSDDESEAVPCRIFNWRSNSSLKFMDLKEMRVMEKKLFDYVIGNPPYQESYQGDSTGANSVYDKFLDASYEVAQVTELIHPARFLFNAGSTSKSWNEKMLNDPHFKVMHYESDATKVFPNTDIKGGVAISYRDDRKNYGEIGIFTPYNELNNIIHKVINSVDFISLGTIGVTSSAYHFTEELHEDYPDLLKRTIVVKGKTQPLLSKGHEYDLKSSIFDKLPEIFLDDKPDDGEEYIQILGRDKTGRSKKYIKKRYVNSVRNLDVYKIFLPKASGNGQFGEELTSPSVEGPGVGATETFYSLGLFVEIEDAQHLDTYIKTKFARALLGILKITQDVNPGKWKYVPLQDFTSSSDLDWSKSIHEIDLQLYRKYRLGENEIEFIETHVKEMA